MSRFPHASRPPFWNICCNIIKGDCVFEAKCKDSPIGNLSEANQILEKIANSTEAYMKTEVDSQSKLPSRYPFNLESLQKEAFYASSMSFALTLDSRKALLESFDFSSSN